MEIALNTFEAAPSFLKWSVVGDNEVHCSLFHFDLASGEGMVLTPLAIRTGEKRKAV